MKNPSMLSSIKNHVVDCWFGYTLMAIGVALFAVGVAVDIANFHECRAHGFSLLYCLTAI